MPIYEFRCADCDTRFETLCRIGSNGEGLDCPQCHGDTLKRVMSAFFSRTSGNGNRGESTSGGSKCSGCSSHNCSTCR